MFEKTKPIFIGPNRHKLLYERMLHQNIERQGNKKTKPILKKFKIKKAKGKIRVNPEFLRQVPFEKTKPIFEKVSQRKLLFERELWQISILLSRRKQSQFQDYYMG